MSTFRSLFYSALIAGMFTGVAISVVHLNLTVPLILKAEVYEDAAGEVGQSHADAASQTEHHHEGNGEQSEVRRDGFTLVALAIAYTGFALVIVSSAEVFSPLLNWRIGLMWGLAGFAVFSLAPSFGLPPELPAMPAAALVPRQLWWVGTAVCTSIGIGLIVKQRRMLGIMAAVAAILAPHVIGAPQPADFRTPIPNNLHQAFMVSTLATSLAGWLILGAVLGFVRPMFEDHPMKLRPFA